MKEKVSQTERLGGRRGREAAGGGRLCRDREREHRALPGNLNPGSLPMWTASPRVPSLGTMCESMEDLLLAQPQGTGQALPEPMPGQGGQPRSPPHNGKLPAHQRSGMLQSFGWRQPSATLEKCAGPRLQKGQARKKFSYKSQENGPLMIKPGCVGKVSLSRRGVVLNPIKTRKMSMITST